VLLRNLCVAANSIKIFFQKRLTTLSNRFIRNVRIRYDKHDLHHLCAYKDVLVVFKEKRNPHFKKNKENKFDTQRKRNSKEIK